MSGAGVRASNFWEINLVREDQGTLLSFKPRWAFLHTEKEERTSNGGTCQLSLQVIMYPLWDCKSLSPSPSRECTPKVPNNDNK